VGDMWVMFAGPNESAVHQFGFGGSTYRKKVTFKQFLLGSIEIMSVCVCLCVCVLVYLCVCVCMYLLQQITGFCAGAYAASDEEARKIPSLARVPDQAKDPKYDFMYGSLDFHKKIFKNVASYLNTQLDLGGGSGCVSCLVAGFAPGCVGTGDEMLLPWR
jgi:hypothetical protein